MSGWGGYDPATSHTTFFGSEEKIAQDKALVSRFRKQNGMNPDPHGALVGTAESIAQQKRMLDEFKSKL